MTISAIIRRSRVLRPDDAVAAGDCWATGVPVWSPATTGGTSDPGVVAVPVVGRPPDDAAGGPVTAEPPTDAVPELPAPPVVVVDPVPAPNDGAAAPMPPLSLTTKVLSFGGLKT